MYDYLTVLQVDVPIEVFARHFATEMESYWQDGLGWTACAPYIHGRLTSYFCSYLMFDPSNALDIGMDRCKKELHGAFTTDEVLADLGLKGYNVLWYNDKFFKDN